LLVQCGQRRVESVHFVADDAAGIGGQTDGQHAVRPVGPADFQQVRDGAGGAAGVHRLIHQGQMLFPGLRAGSAFRFHGWLSVACAAGLPSTKRRGVTYSRSASGTGMPIRKRFGTRPSGRAPCAVS
jgi:hypothetical protein